MRTYIRKFIDYIQPVSIKGKSNHVHISCKPKQYKIRIQGSNNEIVLPENCDISNLVIDISGDNNRLICHEKVRIYGPCRIIMQGNATLILGENCGVRGVEFNVANGLISVGKLCMFSYGIIIRNHDSHKVLKTGGANEVINPSANITIGEHVWICQNASILKGCNIGDNSIVAYGAIATKGCPTNSILAGNPAKVVKTGITWDY